MCTSIVEIVGNAEGMAKRGDEWFPLATLLAWARTRPKNGVKRPGMEWIQRFVQRLSVRP